MEPIIFKITLNNETRRLRFDPQTVSLNGVVQKTVELFPIVDGSDVSFTYVDGDGDKITIKTETDLQEAVYHYCQETGNSTLKLNVEFCSTKFKKSWPRKKVHRGVVCDGCSQSIEGIRYKCLKCPDFDFCEKCENNQSQRREHGEDHIFLRIVKPIFLPVQVPLLPRSNIIRTEVEKKESCNVRVFCDGCQNQITGMRYKCAVCPNYDLCSSCIDNSRDLHIRNHSFIKMSSLSILNTGDSDSPLLFEIRKRVFLPYSMRNQAFGPQFFRFHPRPHCQRREEGGRGGCHRYFGGEHRPHFHYPHHQHPHPHPHPHQHQHQHQHQHPHQHQQPQPQPQPQPQAPRCGPNANEISFEIFGEDILNNVLFPIASEFLSELSKCTQNEQQEEKKETNKSDEAQPEPQSQPTPEPTFEPEPTLEPTSEPEPTHDFVFVNECLPEPVSEIFETTQPIKLEPTPTPTPTPTQPNSAQQPEPTPIQVESAQPKPIPSLTQPEPTSTPVSTPTPISTPSQPKNEVKPYKYEKQLRELEDMGFIDNEANINSLNRVSGNLQRAIELLI